MIPAFQGIEGRRAGGEEPWQQAAPEGRSCGGEGAPEGWSRRGEGAPEGKSLGGEGAPEGRSLGGGAGLAECSGCACDSLVTLIWHVLCNKTTKNIMFSIWSQTGK